jgi:hypothetical protein
MSVVVVAAVVAHCVLHAGNMYLARGFLVLRYLRADMSRACDKGRRLS